MPNFPSWVAPMMKPVQNSAQGLQNLAQTYAQPHMRPRTGGWDGQGVNPNQQVQHPMQHPVQEGLQGLENRIPPELMQFLQPFLGMMQGQGGGMKGLLGFQPVEHDPFKPNQPGGGGGLYGQ